MARFIPILPERLQRDLASTAPESVLRWSLSKELHRSVSIEVFARGGMCDRLYVLGVGLYLRNLLQGGPIALEWRPSRQCDAHFSELFETPEELIYRDGRSAQPCCADIVIPYMLAPQLLWFLSTVNLWPEVIPGVVPSSVRVRFSRRTLAFNSIQWGVALAPIRPVAVLQSRIDRVRRIDQIDKRVIGIHLRGTDKRRGARSDALKRDVARIKHEMSELVRMDLKQRFLVSSDESKLKDELRSFLPHHVIALQTTEVEYDGHRVRRSRENVQDAALELWLLAGTNYHQKIKLQLDSGFTRFPLYLREMAVRNQFTDPYAGPTEANPNRSHAT